MCRKQTSSVVLRHPIHVSLSNSFFSIVPFVGFPGSFVGYTHIEDITIHRLSGIPDAVWEKMHESNFTVLLKSPTNLVKPTNEHTSGMVQTKKCTMGFLKHLFNRALWLVEIWVHYTVRNVHQLILQHLFLLQEKDQYQLRWIIDQGLDVMVRPIGTDDHLKTICGSSIFTLSSRTC